MTKKTQRKLKNNRRKLIVGRAHSDGAEPVFYHGQQVGEVRRTESGEYTGHAFVHPERTFTHKNKTRVARRIVASVQ